MSELVNRLRIKKRSNSRDFSKSQLSLSLKPRSTKQSSSMIRNKLNPISPFLKGVCASVKHQTGLIYAKSQSVVKLPPLEAPSLSQVQVSLIEHDGAVPYDNYIQLIESLVAPEAATNNFWYCNRVGDYYDYEIVTSASKNPQNYLTVSHRGITHMLNGCSRSYSLQEWLEEYYQFYALREIKMFGQFKRWKYFLLWKKLRRVRVITNVETVLNEKLLLLKPEFQHALLDVREQAWTVFRLRLAEFKFSKVRSLAHFMADQHKRRSRLAQALLEVESTIKTKVFSTCTVAIEAAQCMQTEGPIQLRYTGEAIQRYIFVYACRFIQVCDYLVYQAKLEHVVQYAMQMVNYFNGSMYRHRRMHNALNPLLYIKADVEDFSLQLTPSPEELQLAMEDTLMKGTSILLNNKFLILAPEIADYKQMAKVEYVDETLTFSHAALQDPEFKDATKLIFRHITDKYAELQGKAQELLPLLAICKSYSQFKPQSLTRKNIPQIRVLMEEYTTKQGEAAAIQCIADLGFLRLDLTKVKEFIEPYPERCLQLVKDFLPGHAKAFAQRLRKQVNEQNSVVIGICASVEDFIHHRHFFKDLEVMLPSLQARLIELKEYCLLFISYNLSDYDKLKRLQVGIMTRLSILEKKLQNYFEREERERLKFCQQLINNIRQLEERVKELSNRLVEPKLQTPSSSPTEIVSYLASLIREIETVKNDAHNYNCWQVELEMEPIPFKQVAVLAKECEAMRTMWDTMKEWKVRSRKWLATPLCKVNAADYHAEIERYYQIAIESRVLEERGNAVPAFLLSQLAPFHDLVPLIEALRQPDLKQEHWKEIQALVNISVSLASSQFIIESLLSRDFITHRDEIGLIALRARKEREIESTLDALLESWQDMHLKVVYDKVTDNYLLLDTDDLLFKLEESQVIIYTLSNNKFAGGAQTRVNLWQDKFRLLGQTLELWLVCHRHWVELDKIFRNPDVGKKLKDKSRKFSAVNTQYREKLRQASENRNILEICTQPGVYANFQKWCLALEKLQRNIHDYLDKQRTAFPRYYFLANEDILVITANPHTPTIVQQYFRNMFQNVSHLEFDTVKTDAIVAVHSLEGERLLLSVPTKTKGLVEDWLRSFETSIQNSLKRLINEALKTMDVVGRREWILAYPLQALSCADMLNYTSAVEQGFLDENWKSLSELYDNYCSEIEAMSLFVRDIDDLSLHRKLVALISQEIHNRDSLDMLKDEEVVSVHDFRWQQLLRYSLTIATEEITVKQLSTVYRYGYEYFGATTRIVNTPLTDRCWATVSTAFKLNLGTSLSGPAGTGKTESVKDLAKAIGKYCLVFNCSEQLQMRLIERIIFGLSYTGSWACLDEFNRVDVEVLSVIAQLIRAVKRAKDNGRTELTLEDRKIPLNHSMAVFATMNLNYHGRTELPDNLKVLFRPVSMAAADQQLIVEVLLSSEGVVESKRLAQKLMRFVQLATEQLSQQTHYDFGLRAIVSSITQTSEVRKSYPDCSEDALIVQLLKHSMQASLLEEDSTLFFNLLQDVFKDTEVHEEGFIELRETLHDFLTSEQLDPSLEMIETMVQLYLTVQMRRGVILIGKAFSGKSTTLRALVHALNSLAQVHPSYYAVRSEHINPKALSISHLFGEVKEVTAEWHEGVASKLFKKCANDKRKHSWIVFDGPIDAHWVENMNSVLDENQLLCLSNQERIAIPETMRVLFEVENLSYASPATITRCGVVHFSGQVLHWKSIIKTSLMRLPELPEKIHEYLTTLIGSMMARAIKLRQSLVSLMPSCKNSLVTACCSLLLTLLHPITQTFGTFETEKEKRLIDKLVLFSFIWSLGGSLDEESSIKFETQLSHMLVTELPRESLYDYFISIGRPGGEFHKWETLIPVTKISPEQTFYDIYVPTKDSIRIPYMSRKCLEAGRPVLITGHSGVGKTKLLMMQLSDLEGTGEYHVVREGFTSGTTSKDIEQALYAKLEAKAKGTLEAPQGKKILLFIDNLNLPKPNEYEAQPAIETMRELIESGYIYNTEKLRQVTVERMSYMCCAAPALGGKETTTQRMTRHFHILGVPELDMEAQMHIFRVVLEHSLRYFTRDITSFINTIVSATSSIYFTCKTQLKPTPSKPFYSYSFRDLQRVYQGLLRATTQHFTTTESIVNLWVHENLRVYGDRLFPKEKEWFANQLARMTNQFFRKELRGPQLIDDTFLTFSTIGSQSEEYVHTQADMLEMHIQQEIDKSGVRQFRDFVLFREAVINMCKVARVLGMERGHALLLGTSGVGKNLIVQLAVFVTGFQLYTLQITKNYALSDLREDIRKLYLSFSSERVTPTVFLLTDSQILSDAFLEDINTMLSEVSISNLFSKEDLETLDQNLRHLVDDSNSSIYEFFVERIRKSLHIVLTLRLDSTELAGRFKTFRSLTTACSILLINSWASEARIAVANNRLAAVHLPLSTPKTVSILAQLLVKVYDITEDQASTVLAEQKVHIYFPPKTFLGMLDCYKELLSSLEADLVAKRQKYSNGCEQITRSKAEIINEEARLQELLPRLEAKRIESQALTERLEEETENANLEKASLEAEEREVTAATNNYKVLKKEAELELKRALPVLEDAIKALKQLSATDISEIRTFINPPPLTLYTLEAIAILFEKPLSWESIKKMLLNNFLDRLQHFDRRSIKPATLAKLKNKISSNINFTPEQVGHQNLASKSLCKWVFAIENYCRVSEEVKPRRLALKEMNRALSESMKKLRAARRKLALEFQKVEALEQQLRESLEEKAAMDAQIRSSNERIARARTLTTSLRDEAIRWLQQAEEASRNLSFLLGDSFVSAAVITYAGPFSYEYRQTLVQKWLEACAEARLPVTLHYDFINSVGQPVQIRAWKLAGLAAGPFSLTNALVITRSTRVPLIYDPQLQALRWLKNLAGGDLHIGKERDADFWKLLEHAMRDGLHFIIRDVQSSLNPLLDDLLASYSKNATVVVLGKNRVQLHSKFKLYLISTLSSPVFAADIYNRASVVNFQSTLKALEEQLLIEAVRLLAPELERVRNSLEQTISSARDELDALEATILQSLSRTDTNILDDPDIVSELERVKSVVDLMNEQIQSSEANQRENEAARSVYQPIAFRGSLLYFEVAALSKVDWMYQFSLTRFIELFTGGLESSHQKDVDQLVRKTTWTIFEHATASLFNRHRITFAFMLATRLLIAHGNVSESEWLFFLRGEGFASGLSLAFRKNPISSAISNFVWLKLGLLAKACEPFASLLELIEEAPQQWTDWVLSSAPHQTFIAPYTDLSTFHKLLLIKEVRPDLLMHLVIDIIRDNLGEAYCQVSSITARRIQTEFSSRHYVIFLIGPGDDPMSLLYDLAARTSCNDRIRAVSIGRGQEVKAKATIQRGINDGHWVILENCHLSSILLTELEPVVESLLEFPAVHPEFRLFLTTSPTTSFPSYVLQHGFKVTIEQPKGIKLQLQRSLDLIDTTDVPKSSHDAFLRLSFCLALFHGVVNERKKFGPRAWSKPYEFSHTDVEVMMLWLRVHVDTLDLLMFKYVVSDLIYGGRISEPLDRSHIAALSSLFFPQEILHTSCHFSHSGTYRIPSEISLLAFTRYAKQLPILEEPEIYGLDTNAQITAEQQENHAFLNSLLSLAVSKQLRGGQTKLAESEQFQSLLSALPEFKKTLSLKSYFQTAHDPLQIYFIQETERFEVLLNTVRENLNRILLAYTGRIMLTDQFEVMAEDIQRNTIPQAWKKLDYGMSKPLSQWILGLQARVTDLQQCLSVKRSVFTPSVFIYPKGFFSALLQKFSQTNNYSLEVSSFSFEFMKSAEDLEEEPQDGAYVSGLYFEGCRWNYDTGCLGDTLPGETFSRAPIILFEPIDHHYVEPDDYLMPLYKSAERKDTFLVTVECPTTQPTHYWTLKGAALVCHGLE